jgi:hypothetical protein
MAHLLKENREVGRECKYRQSILNHYGIVMLNVTILTFITLRIVLFNVVMLIVKAPFFTTIGGKQVKK